MDILRKKVKILTNSSTVEIEDTQSQDDLMEGETGQTTTGWLGINSSLTERISFYLFLLMVFLLPIVALPASFGVSLELLKKVTLVSLTLGSFLFWLLAKLEDGRISVPKNNIIFSAIGILIVSGLSTIFSDSISTSFSGLAVDEGSLLFLFVSFIALFLASVFFRETNSVTYFFLTFFSSLAVVFVVTVANSFLEFLPGGKIGNLIGKINDLGVIWGLSLLISTMFLEISNIPAQFKKPLFLFVILSFVGLFFVNFGLLWVLLSAIMLVLFIMSLFINGPFGGFVDRGDGNRKSIISRASFLVLIVLILLTLNSSYIGGVLNKLGFSQTEVRPSWSSTVEVIKQTLNEHPILGSGPNSFSRQWVLYKPADVNVSPFWNTDFNVAVGRIPTFVVTLGILGTLAWLSFLLLFLFYGLKFIFSKNLNGSRKVLLPVSFVASLYL